MKFRMLASLLILTLVPVLVIGGISTAWFTSKDAPPSAAAFLVGTVDIDITEEEAIPDEFQWKIEEGEDFRDFNWTIKNVGSKGVYLRAWLEETLLPFNETAWGEGTRFVNPGNWAMYFLYEVGGYTDANPKTVRLIAGQHYEAGTVKVWEGNINGTRTLFVEYATVGWEMSGVHLAVADDLSLIPTTQNGPELGNPQVGRFPFKPEPEFDELRDTYLFTIPMEGNYPSGALKDRPYEGVDVETLFIAAHADLIGVETKDGGINWSQRDCQFHWEYNEDEGYWYYCLEPVFPGEEVSLCLTGYPEKNGLYTVKFYTEAVQALPEALRELWPGAPCLQGDSSV